MTFRTFPRTNVDAATAPQSAMYLTVNREDSGDAFFEALDADVSCSVYADKIRTLTQHNGMVMFFDALEDAELIVAFNALPGADEQLVWLDAQHADGHELV